jgi:hypothetical protein
MKQTLIHLHIPNIKKVDLGSPARDFYINKPNVKVCITLDDDGILYVYTTDSDCPKGP